MGESLPLSYRFQEPDFRTGRACQVGGERGRVAVCHVRHLGHLGMELPGQAHVDIHVVDVDLLELRLPAAMVLNITYAFSLQQIYIQTVCMGSSNRSRELIV